MPQQKVEAPTTRAELEAQTIRRGELKDQLRSSEERRFQLSQQLERTGTDGRAALQERVSTLDGRIGQLERQIQALDDAIATGLANPALTQHHAEVEVPTPPPVAAELLAEVARSRAMAMVPPPFGPAIPINGRTLLAGGLVTISLLALTGWLAFRYALARMSRMGGLASGNPAQATQLQQSLDAIAVEVERISENQRYVTRMLGQAPASAQNVADAREPIAVNRKL